MTLLQELQEAVLVAEDLVEDQHSYRWNIFNNRPTIEILTKELQIGFPNRNCCSVLLTSHNSQL